MSPETHAHTAHDETDTHPIDHHEKEGCDKHCDCGLCSGHYFKAVLFHIFNIPPIGQFNLTGFQKNATSFELISCGVPV